jgi:DNA-binding MarR family transcriptional regulator
MDHTTHKQQIAVRSPARHDNILRHATEIATFVQRSTMTALQETGAYPWLRMRYAPYITAAATGLISASDLAVSLGVSRQAAHQVVNELERQGCLSRKPSECDHRKKVLCLTAAGRRLLARGAEEAAAVQEQVVAELSPSDRSALNRSLHQVAQALAIGTQTPQEASNPFALAIILPQIAERLTEKLAVKIRARELPLLSVQAGWILDAVSRGQARLTSIAERYDLSKQVASAASIELEKHQLISSRRDPSDPRQKTLSLAPAGERLLDISLACIRELNQELTVACGAPVITQCSGILSRLYATLERLQHHNTLDDEALANHASKLLVELGDANTHRLIQHLHQQLLSRRPIHV